MRCCHRVREHVVRAAIGQELTPLQTSDAHKWLCAPKGSAWLWVSKELQGTVLPTSISSGASGGYQSAFQWVGTWEFLPRQGAMVTRSS